MDFMMIFSQLGKGLIVSVEIFILTLVFSMPLGLLVSFGRMSKNIVIRTIMKVYISIMRGTPLMLQLIVVYFAPYYVLGMKISSTYRFIAVIIGFAVNYAAYFAEIYRGGIESMPKGQYEAAQVLGYGKAQTFWKIILPQVIKRILPAVTNEIITLVKDTSLAFVIAVAEMFTIAKQIAAAQASIFPLMIAGAYYFIFNLVVALIMEYAEKKCNYYR
ncbi:MAG: amino acid ABC transporter permease [Lachnospiraceae bacterium]